MPKKFDYRLKIMKDDAATFFYRRGDRTAYISASETPLALANLLQEHSAETRFRLEDALDGKEAAWIMREVLGVMWKANPKRAPVVTLLDPPR